MVTQQTIDVCGVNSPCIPADSFNFQIYIHHICLFCYYFSLPKADTDKAMEENKATDGPSQKDQREYSATTEEKKVGFSSEVL